MSALVLPNYPAPHIINASAEWDEGSGNGTITLTFDKDMMTDADRCQTLSMVDNGHLSSSCAPIGWTTARIWQGTTPELYNYLRPFTLEYAASSHEDWRFKSVDGYYLQNFADMPITITDV